MGEITLGASAAGRSLDEISDDLPEGVQVTMVRKAGQNIVPVSNTVLSAGDAVLVVA